MDVFDATADVIDFIALTVIIIAIIFTLITIIDADPIMDDSSEVIMTIRAILLFLAILF